jgi:hypothetical protein
VDETEILDNVKLDLNALFDIYNFFDSVDDDIESSGDVFPDHPQDSLGIEAIEFFMDRKNRGNLEESWRSDFYTTYI